MTTSEFQMVSDEILTWRVEEAPCEAIEIRLTQFLEGLGFPLDPSEEPWQVIIRVVLECGADQPVAWYAARLLNGWLENTWQPFMADRARYNLLRLCGELEGAEHLRGPVWKLYARRRELVLGAYEGALLRSGLLAAMIRNQPVDKAGVEEARALWKDLLAERPVADFPGLLIDGFHGLVAMPDLSDLPTLDLESALGRAIAPVWRRAQALNRPDIFDREFLCTMKMYPGLDHYSVLWAADYLPAVPQRFRRDALLLIEKIPDAEQRAWCCAEVEKVVESVAPDMTFPRLKSDDIASHIRMLLPEPVRKVVMECAFPPTSVSGSMFSPQAATHCGTETPGPSTEPA